MINNITLGIVYYCTVVYCKVPSVINCISVSGSRVVNKFGVGYDCISQSADVDCTTGCNTIHIVFSSTVINESRIINSHCITVNCTTVSGKDSVVNKFSSVYIHCNLITGSIYSSQFTGIASNVRID